MSASVDFGGCMRSASAPAMMIVLTAGLSNWSSSTFGQWEGASVWVTFLRFQNAIVASQ
jgi:hypothetical protein